MNEQLPESRLSTTDEQGYRVYVHPIEVKGYWATLRSYTSWFLIAIYLIVPWIYINGRQVILLDLPKREFYLFGTTFYGHDGPLLIFLLLGFILFISFVTSVWGRVWCGYACPQTVFIERIFRKIEAFVEGGARRREKLHQMPWNFEKLSKKSVKWFLFILVSLHIVHSGLGYFVGTHRLIEISLQAPTENMGLFITMLVMTFIILFDFGWFREQFCIIACPYGRFQSIAMDENSKIVAYDEKRGEPRRNPGITRAQEGDCVNCSMCVKACPTGIDIRDGLQMECIACTACIDACDTIMDKVKKPRGLIRYSSENELEGKPRSVQTRSYIYLTLLFIVLVAAITQVNLRQEFRAQFLRGSSVPYQVITKSNTPDTIVNHFIISISYYRHHDEEIILALDGKYKDLGIKLVSNEMKIVMDKDNKKVNYFFQFPKTILEDGERSIQVNFMNVETNEILKTKEVILVGPIK